MMKMRGMRTMHPQNHWNENEYENDGERTKESASGSEWRKGMPVE